jgi:hypothetical protein
LPISHFGPFDRGCARLDKAIVIASLDGCGPILGLVGYNVPVLRTASTVPQVPHYPLELLFSLVSRACYQEILNHGGFATVGCLSDQHQASPFETDKRWKDFDLNI